MYIKKILWAIALIGLVVFGLFAYYIYGAMFQPNTNFNNETAYIYVPTNATFQFKVFDKLIIKFAYN